MTKSPAFSDKPLTDSEQITDATRIARLLDRMAQQHTLLTVVLPGADEEFTSSIVEVEAPFVLLDELLPTSGHRALLGKRRLQVTGKLDGIDMRFVSALEDVDEADGMITYRVALPDRLEYRQRRSDYRARIPVAKLLRVTLYDDAGDIVEGKLYDLSRGGVGVILPGDSDILAAGNCYECAIELPDDTWLVCEVMQRHAKALPAGDRHLAGLQFTTLTPVQVRLVGRCISLLERESIRKRVTD